MSTPAQESFQASGQENEVRMTQGSQDEECQDEGLQQVITAPETDGCDHESQSQDVANEIGSIYHTPAQESIQASGQENEVTIDQRSQDEESQDEGLLEVITAPATDGCDYESQSQVVANEIGATDGVSDKAQEEPPMDDQKTMFQKAFELIDRTSRRFRRPSTSSEREISQDSVAINIELAIHQIECDRLLSPTVARAEAKAACAYVSCSVTGNRQRTSLAPGAEHVPSRAPGVSPAFYLRLIRRNNSRMAREAQQTAPQEEAVVEESATQSAQGRTENEQAAESENPRSNEPSQQDNSNSNARVTVVDGELMDPESLQLEKRLVRSRLILCVALLLILMSVGAVVVGLCVFDRKAPSPRGFVVTTLMDPPSHSCDNWHGSRQPNVVTQCFCVGKITTVAKDVIANYQRLKSDGFIQGFSSSIDSCDPSNQALVWLASATGSSSPHKNIQQRYAMALIYITWNGWRWTSNTGWLSTENECTWRGVTCDRFGRVIGIYLQNNELSGDLGTAFTMLTKLEALSVGQNALRGSVPVELTNLASLKSLILEINQLTGTLPVELTKLSLLNELKLGKNDFTGTMPTWLGQLSNLQTLNLQNISFTPIQSNRGNVTVSTTRLKRNAFPTEIGLLTKLQTLELGGTGLKGTIPTEIFNLGQTLVFLQLYSNSLSGTIPNLIGNLEKLFGLSLDDNNLTGTIPMEFVKCTGLAYLFMSNNRLSGTVPSSLALTTGLQILKLRGNNLLSGTIPESICKITRPEICPSSRLECACCVCKDSRT